MHGLFILVTGTDAGEREDSMAKDNSELAILYQVETKTFNQAVKRNIERFPENFRFQLKKEEYDSYPLFQILPDGYATPSPDY